MVGDADALVRLFLFNVRPQSQNSTTSSEIRVTARQYAVIFDLVSIVCAPVHHLCAPLNRHDGYVRLIEHHLLNRLLNKSHIEQLFEQLIH